MKLPAIAALTLALAANAQTRFVQNFDTLTTDGCGCQGPAGPPELTAQGWIFRNQSNPPGQGGYFRGYLEGGWPQPQSGAGYLMVNGLSAAESFNGRFCIWGILPVVPGQQGGDQFTIWTNGQYASGDTTFEVRYSPTGGLGTGSGHLGVGDFTQAIISSTPVPNSGWVMHTGVVPGNGRLAIRTSGPGQRLFQPVVFIGLDSLSVGVPPPPPCNVPPSPTPGQTVTWTAANSPYRVCQNIAIPPGSTVIVEPGVSVTFEAERELTVGGTLDVRGTAAAPVTFAAETDGNAPRIEARFGTVLATHAAFHLPVVADDGATIRLSDCAVIGRGMTTWGGEVGTSDIPGPWPFIELRGCTFTNAHFSTTRATTILGGNTFNDCYTLSNGGYVKFDPADPNAFTAQPMFLFMHSLAQPLLVDGVHASGMADTGGITLYSGHFLLGPANSFQNNRFPVELVGGLMPGSVLPITGNINNQVRATTGPQFAHWPRLAIPYRINTGWGGPYQSRMLLDPGVEILMDAGQTIAAAVVAEGTPEMPITVRGGGANPAGTINLSEGTYVGARLDWVNVTGAGPGVRIDGAVAYMDNCRVEGANKGVDVGDFGVLALAKCVLTGNATGATVGLAGELRLSNPGTPNVVAGNGVGVRAQEFDTNVDAREVWWGDPSGPAAPDNPGGLGNPVIGAGVEVLPFLTAPPDAADTPPLVRMEAPGIDFNTAEQTPDFLLEPGTHVVLRWEARDNSAIAYQRVLISPDGFYPDSFLHVADLPGDVRSYDLVVPGVGFASRGGHQFVMIQAFDDAGQMGMDYSGAIIPSLQIGGTITLTSEEEFEGRTFAAGDPIPPFTFTGDVTDFPTYDKFVFLESVGAILPYVTTRDAQGAIREAFPPVSTDRARLVVRARTDFNDQVWQFSRSYFTIRHDPRLALSPPVVSLDSPAPGAVYAGGDSVPVLWTASAAEGLYGFDIQASYDAGRTWHWVKRGLPAQDRGFTWALPATDGIPDVRVRVVARDRRFQDSAADAAFTVTFGVPGAPCDPDLNADGNVDQDDVLCIINTVAGNPGCSTQDPDFNRDGNVDQDDVVAVITAVAGGGCP